MPNPRSSALQAGPDGLLAWLDNNLLMAGTLQNVLAPDARSWVTLTPYAQAYPGQVIPTAVNSANAPIDIYQLRSNGAGAHDSLPAFIVNYTAGQVHRTTLSNAADFVFTTNLNGCTFGIGPAAPNGSRRVCHANTGGNSILQRQQVRGALQSGDLAGHSLLEPATYRSVAPGYSMQATVFGIRNGLNWRFYFQSYGRPNGGGAFRLFGVFPIG